jgi:cellobiose-specific phosphotransferase system component IIB
MEMTVPIIKQKFRVLAACALGASISFFVKNLIEAARKRDIELEVITMTIDQVHHANLDDYDLILVAPQVRFHANELRKRTNKPIVEIDRLHYAIGDGESAFVKLLPILKG